MVGRRRVLAIQPALVASQHPAVLLLGGPSTEKVNRYPRKLPDGTLIWTSPSRDTYVTTPGSALLSPSLCAPTGAVTGPTPALQSTDRAQMVPKRKRTRAENKTPRIAAERTLNRQDREVELGWRRWEQALAMATIKDEPPPF